jgi:hypothetical protein
MRWAKMARARLIESLGAVCAWCKSPEQIECDCIQPRGHGHHKAGSINRVVFYRQEARTGNLQLLCGPCHRVKSRWEVGA